MRIRLLRHAGLQGSEGRGLPDHSREFESGDDHDGPGAGGRDLYRTDHAGSRRENRGERAPRRDSPDDGRTNGAEHRLGAAQARYSQSLRGRADRRESRSHRQGRRSPALPRGDARNRIGDTALEARAQPRRGGGGAGIRRPAGDYSSVIHARRNRWRRRLQPRRIFRDRRTRARRIADGPDPHRRKRSRLEGIRDGGRPRQGGQLHHHLHDRKRRSDGGAHRRQHHRRAGA